MDNSQEKLTEDELNLHSLKLVQDLQAIYKPGRDRKVTTENVYQQAVLEGRDVLEAFVDRILLPGSAVEGLEHLDDCLRRMAAGETILFMPEHRGNLDVPTFYALLGREKPAFRAILDRLIYIAGRKLNESSDFIKMFTEKYSRLVIVPRRELPRRDPGESQSRSDELDAYEAEAKAINRSAFRELVRLRKQGFLFVLYPLGGRLKPDADNVPVKESISYMNAFDTTFLISMEGNLLPPGPEMEKERPVQERVVFRVGPAMECKPFLARQKALFEQGIAEGKLQPDSDFEQFAVDRIMVMLERLRLEGCYDPDFPVA